MPRKAHPPGMNELPDPDGFVAEDAEAYDAWFRAKVRRSLADTRPPVPHEQVMAEMRAIIRGKAKPTP